MNGFGSETPDPTADFLKGCLEPDSGLLRSVTSLDVDPRRARRFLRRPLFRPHRQMVALCRDIAEIHRLLEGLPGRCFGGDVDRFLAAQGRSTEHIDMIRRGSVGETTLYGRPDGILCDGEFKLIELNPGSDVGGIPMMALNPAVLDNPPFRAFADGHGLQWVDTLAVLTDRLRATARSVVGCDDPTVAIVEETGSGGTCQGLADALAARGVRVVLGELRDVSLADGKVTLGGVAADVVLRYFFVDHLLREEGGKDKITMLADAHIAGRTALFTSLDTAIIESKAALGLLYADEIFQRLTEAEQDLVSRRIPWTRLLYGTFGPQADRRDVVESYVRRREELVLKPAFGSGGTGVHLGAAMSPDEWRAALEFALDNTYVVQSRVISDPEEIIDPDSGEAEDWHINWGVFFAGDDYAGSYARALRRADLDVIKRENQQTRFGCVFSH